MKLKTLEEALHEAQGGSIDIAAGYSVLKDIFKRQNFEVKSARYVGKKKVEFTYTDRDYKDKDKELKVSVIYSLTEMTKEEYEKAKKEFLKDARLSYTSNRYNELNKVMSNKLGLKKASDDESGRITLWKETQIVNKEATYTFAIESYNKNNGEFIRAYKLEILAKK